MFAALAQHLCAALVPLDVGATHGALLDGHVSITIRADPVFPERGAHIRSRQGIIVRRHAGLISLQAGRGEVFI